MHAPDPNYKIPTCKEWVPEPLRFWLYIAFVLSFQFSGAVYMALASQRAGAQGILREDVMMSGNAMLVGMTMVFPILFPLKFSFAGKNTLLFCSLGLVACNLITLYARSMAILVPVCFFAGGIRMLGTFECFSTIQLKITPTRDFAKFFPVIYMIILGMVQFSGMMAGRIANRFQWEAMHVLVIGSLLCVALGTRIFLRYVRLPAPFPMGKIDWLGGALWALLLLQIAFVLNYGEHFEWFDGHIICGVTVTSLVTLLVIVWRSHYIVQPYIEFHAFRHRNVLTSLGLFAALCLLLAAPEVLQRSYTSGVLHYGSLETFWLNGPVLAGIVFGAVLCYVGFAKFEVGYRGMTILGFLMVLGYLIGMYLVVSPATTREAMIAPLFLRGAGNVMIFVVLTTYAARTVPMHHFFQVLCIMGFVHTDLGDPLGGAVVERMLAICMRKSIQSLGTVIDGQDTFAAALPFEKVVSEFQRQVLLVSVKEGFGILILFSILVLCISAATRYRKAIRLKMPRW